MTMGYCDIHNWSSHGFKKCPQCVKEENITSEEDTMSKMSELATETHSAAMGVAEMLYQALDENGSAHSMNKQECVEFIAVVLVDEADSYPCHDFIGEALHRRRECQQYIEKLALVQTEIKLLNKQLGVSAAARVKAQNELDLMHHNFRAQGEEVLQLRDEEERLINELNEYTGDGHGDPVSVSTNAGTGIADEPANGYVMLSTSDTWCKYSSLDELITDQIGFSPTNFNCYNSVYELGAQVRSVSTVTWEEVK
jgi:hypothetical protein